MKNKIVKEYTNEEITVIWKADLCAHSTNCWKNLVSVFDPRRRPWVDMEAASSDEIIKAVDNCPSRALSYRINKGVEMKEEEKSVDVKIKPAKNGPYLISGNFTILDSEGNIIESDKKVALCRCGASGNKPFCDGTHKQSGFEG